jgi:hypothetical protein
MVVTGSKKDGLFIMAFKKIDGSNKLPNGAKVIKTGEWVHIGFKKADDVIAYAKFGDITEAVSVDMRTKGYKEAMARGLLRASKAAKKSELDKTLEDANKSLTGKNEDMTAGGSDSTGEIAGKDMPLKKKKTLKRFKQSVQENVDKVDSAAPSDVLAENIEDRHADAWIRFEKYESKLSKKQKKEFYAANDSFDEGHEDDDDDQMDDALDDMLAILKKARIPKK